MLTERTPQAASVAVLIRLAELDPFGDDAYAETTARPGLSDRCRDDGVIFNSAI